MRYHIVVSSTAIAAVLSIVDPLDPRGELPVRMPALPDALAAPVDPFALVDERADEAQRAAIAYLAVTLPLIGLVNAAERRLRSGLVGIAGAGG